MAITRESIAKEIAQKGKLPGGRAYVSRRTAASGRPPLKMTSGRAILRTAAPGKVLPRANRRTAASDAPTTVGTPPAGFGEIAVWDAKDQSALLVVFLNAADAMGVSIFGVKRTDRITVSSAAGTASYAEETKNKYTAAIVSVVAAGASVAATALGAPEVVPVIKAGEKFAKDNFKPEKVKTKRRDAFGTDPGSGHKARQEGGVLISMPGSLGPSYSGDGDTTSRWIKPDGSRTFSHNPTHVKKSFFLSREGSGDNSRVAQEDGEIYITPWDWFFEDNFGYYKLVIRLQRGTGQPPGPVE